MARLFAGRDGERGQSLVEFALALPVFLLLVTGIFDVGRMVWQANTLAYAAREGTRYAIVHGAGGNPRVGPCDDDSENCVNPTTKNLGNVVTVVRQAAVGVANITVTIDYPNDTNQRNDPVVVDATAPFVPAPSQFFMGGAFSITLRGGSELAIQR